jgi:hypothetical protein
MAPGIAPRWLPTASGGPPTRRRRRGYQYGLPPAAPVTAEKYRWVPTRTTCYTSTPSPPGERNDRKQAQRWERPVTTPPWGLRISPCLSTHEPNASPRRRPEYRLVPAESQLASPAPAQPPPVVPPPTRGSPSSDLCHPTSSSGSFADPSLVGCQLLCSGRFRDTASLADLAACSVGEESRRPGLGRAQRLKPSPPEARSAHPCTTTVPSGTIGARR